jgi:hypothetical protein
MANNKTTTLSQRWLNHYFRGHVGGTVLPQPTALYLSLHSASPGEGGSAANELSGNGYARTQIFFDDAPTVDTIANTQPVVFPRSTGAWATATDFGIWDAPTGGSCGYYGPLQAPIVVDQANRKVEFEPGDITVQET